MREFGTLKLKMSISYYEMEGIDVEEMQEDIVCRLANYGDVELTQIVEDGDEIEINAELECEAVRTFTPSSWDNPGDEEISVSLTETELEDLLTVKNIKPFVNISSEEWAA